jgi:hypothetical protein
MSTTNQHTKPNNKNPASEQIAAAATIYQEMKKKDGVIVSDIDAINHVISEVKK